MMCILRWLGYPRPTSAYIELVLDGFSMFESSLEGSGLVLDSNPLAVPEGCS